MVKLNISQLDKTDYELSRYLKYKGDYIHVYKTLQINVQSCRFHTLREDH